MLRKRFAAVLIAVPLAVAGCSGNAATPGASNSTAAGSATASDAAAAQPGQEIDGKAFFEKAQKAMIAAGTYSMTVQMDSPSEKSTMTGVGDVSDAAHPKADMTLALPGGNSKMHLIIDGQNVFMQMPGTATDGKFVQMPISALSQAGGQDVMQLMNPAENLKLTQAAVDKVVYQGKEDVSGEQLQRYRITMDPQKIQQGLSTSGPGASPSSAPEPLPYDLWTDSENRMRKMTMTIEGTSMTMLATDYGKPVTIAAPPSASVTRMPGLSGPASQAPTSPAPASPAPTTTTP